ncbi:MAG: hypothetical protein KDC90_04100 [Ignavibacteriae bacterium]|nr:hypothetical protein [Ignavibacteriota bacterium]
MMSEKEIINLLLDENINDDDKDKFLDEISKHPKINDLKRIVDSLSKLNENFSLSLRLSLNTP